MIVAIFVLAIAALIAYSTAGRNQYKVEVCIAFGGQQKCRIASARSQDAAVRTAVETACAEISSGVTDTVKCQNTTPQSVRWLKGR